MLFENAKMKLIILVWEVFARKEVTISTTTRSPNIPSRVACMNVDENIRLKINTEDYFLPMGLLKFNRHFEGQVIQENRAN